MSKYHFEYEGDEPYLDLTFSVDGEQETVRVDWETTTLFSHRDTYRHLDHIFIERERQEPIDGETYRAIGFYIWRHVVKDFDDLSNALILRDFPMIHRPYPAEVDVQAYEMTTGKTAEPEPKEPIVEDEDEQIVQDAIRNLDAEIKYYLGETDV